jgi:hypothetical protein
MTWAQLTATEKAAAVRPLVEDQGKSYREAAAILGTTRLAIAGVIERNGLRASSGLKAKRPSPEHLEKKARRAKGGTTATIQEKARKARAAANAKPYQGVTRYVALDAPPETVDTAPLKSKAWVALEGSTPVTLDQRTGCAWPIGENPFMFCNLPLSGHAHWCPEHVKAGTRPVAVGTSARSKTRQERAKL